MTAREWRGLSAGLETALRGAGAEPLIVAAPHPGATIAAAWRGQVPILTRGDRIYWPNAPADLSGTGAMAVLQHELQHVLDYTTGWLTGRRYLGDPRHWSYAIDPGWIGDFATLGAEQRAVLTERLWLAEAGVRPRAEIAGLRAVIPWAREASAGPAN